MKWFKHKILHKYIMGFIYELICNTTGERYFGKSNGNYDRFTAHKKKSNTCTSKIIMDRNNYVFNILETTDKLEEREYYYITNFECINKNIPYTEEDSKIIRHRKEEKERYYLNQEFYKQKSNNRYYENHTVIREQRNKKIICECGETYTYGNKARHFKSKIHKSENKNDDNI